MIEVLRNPSYAKLFSAQVIALLGTGLLTVALGLLAFDIAGGDAGLVLGTAMTIKMIAYVAVSPVMSALTVRLPRKPVLISADLLRLAVALALPMVDQAWQIYVLIFILQAASATFTPTFQAVIPEVLPDERQYTRALSLSRLAYDTESLVSPMIAAALLTVVAYNNLFIGTALGFFASTVLVLSTRFPAITPAEPAPFLDRLTLGARIFWRTPQLRSLLAMNLVVAAASAMVIVNTVVLVQGPLQRPEADVALLLAAYGAGSMIVALIIPRLLDKVADQPVMLVGAGVLPVGLVAMAAAIAVPTGQAQWIGLLIIWLLLGAATSLVLTPSARLLRRASTEESRPAVFAAQFSLSHACFLLTYPTAGALGAWLGLPDTALILAGLGLFGAILAVAAWRPRFHSGLTSP
ncbi:MFS transporter [Corynebacterium halotolerans]|uniref:Putative nickel resistance protein (NreB) n=1 Tax=Corynebacterium halotolerans YIM 70093 = DSM 44683 TaxID=1121362 RepID=M1PAY8_9CORY|nr:MFS transporter [Corynebacterium halotolerans]AGF73836.1 putative nickel resistance protein (nreB) [Corynebacterium halotolerans YIM 70093 = DSM 44683]